MPIPYIPLSARTRTWAPSPLARSRGFQIARIFGIQITLDPSWFIIIILVVLSIHAQFAFLFEDSVAPATLWITALVEGLLFFGSVLLHELSHSLVARKLGVGVHSITLFIFGGVSSLKEEPAQAKDELLISGVGPLTSLGLAALAALVSLALPADSFPRYFFHWLSVTNALLAVFNLLPGFPLDGGRVLRAMVWRATGNMARGTRVASITGSAIAYGLMTLGVLLFLFNGGIINGLWFILIGWFLLGAAQSSISDLHARGILSHHDVRQVMRTDCPRIPASLSIEAFVNQILFRTGERCFFVMDGESLAGLLTLRDLRTVERERWGEVTVRDVMVPVERIRHVRPSDSLLSAMEIMNRHYLHQLPVMEDAALAGVVTRDAVLRAVEIDLELERAGSRA
ncbi:MAG TPA: site-2 protease family protein [Planctomycetota bacterium]|nr:site-2 protease family protein [Planctomycetota bacterium]